MHDQYQVHITRSQFIFAHHSTSHTSGVLGSLLRKEWVREVIHKTREAAVFGLATLTVGMLLLGGVYLFLIQLASYGW